jgi:hypothetical protein
VWYSPSLLLTRAAVAPVLSFTTRKVTPGIGAPDTSRTSPPIVPVPSCAVAVRGSAAASITATHTLIPRDIEPPPAARSERPTKAARRAARAAVNLQLVRGGSFNSARLDGRRREASPEPSVA